MLFDPLPAHWPPDRALYALLTSGSSSLQKVVWASYAGLSNRIEWAQSAYPLAHGDVSALLTPLVFVDSIWQIFGPLTFSTPLFIPHRALTEDPILLNSYLIKLRVTRIVCVPSLLRLLCDVAWSDSAHKPPLSMITSSGEPLAIDLLNCLVQLFPNANIVNLYGMTEASADSTCYEATKRCCSYHAFCPMSHVSVCFSILSFLS